ncbi:DegV family protein [Paenibacillus sp. SC116]|uniref:DegV family protein n=1 Tax=Paenibacillus sp. SC116 TaxID=2968986 RepID=UPI00215A9CEF|nr:DegV family protein [Paenibacillus sp. SC116]MCR8844998.1 DegV family protein [Paenibacillus sp. SC116]
MTKKIAWITDSTAYMPDNLKHNEDVFVIPMGIVFGNDVFDDGIDLTTEELYRRIREEKEMPKTSQPPIGRYAALFEQLKTAGYDCAIAIHVSEKISGTLACCHSAADLASFDVEVVDSKAMSYVLTTLLYKGLELAEQGLSYQEIAAQLRQEANKAENYIVLGNLDQFYKGGRMTGTQYLVGSLLRIKPVLRIHEGAFELFDKVRSEKKAYARLVELFQHAYERNHIQSIQIMHGNVIDKAESLKQQIQALFPQLEVVIGEISSAIAVHAGEGTVAVIWHNEPKNS